MCAYSCMRLQHCTKGVPTVYLYIIPDNVCKLDTILFFWQMRSILCNITGYHCSQVHVYITVYNVLNTTQWQLSNITSSMYIYMFWYMYAMLAIVVSADN